VHSPVDGRIVTGPVCAIGTVWIGRQTELTH
jgi:hypothetical protein